MTRPLAIVPGLLAQTPPLKSGCASNQSAASLKAAVAAAEAAARIIEAFLHQLVPTLDEVRHALADDQTRTAVGLGAAARKLGETAHWMQEMAAQSSLLALRLTLNAAQFDGPDRGVDDRPRPAASRLARSIVEVAAELRDLNGVSRRTMVAGAVAGCGTTLTALTLARLLAREARVVLVELPQAAPRLASFTLDPLAPGIAELLRGTASFDQIIGRDRVSGLHVVAAGQSDADQRTPGSGNRLKLMLDALALSYDQVIIDAGAVPEIAVDSVSQLADRVVLLGVEAENVTDTANRLITAGVTDIMVAKAAPSTQVAPSRAARRTTPREAPLSGPNLAGRHPSADQAVFIGAHPDDIEIGAGGTLLKLLAEHWDVFVCIVTDETDPNVAAIRRREALQSCAALGLGPQRVFFLGISDGYVTVTREGVDRLREALKHHGVHPELVFTHSQADCHNDHRAVCGLVHAAFRQKVILGFPIINSLNETLFIPQVYCDITDHLEAKLRALEMHHSQMTRGRISLADIEQYNRSMGGVLGCRLSEAFDLTKQYGASNADVEALLARAGLVSERRLAEGLALRTDESRSVSRQQINEPHKATAKSA